jgi:tyrosine-protein kinase Etk/Wzc
MKTAESTLEEIPDSAVDGDLLAAENAGPIRQIEMLAELARNKWTIAKVTGAFVIVGLVLCITLPERFEATARITTPSQIPSISMLLDQEAGGLGSLASAASGGLGLRDPNAVFVGMLESRTIADALISQFKLKDVYGTSDMTGARKKLHRRSDIKAGKDNLVSIAVTDADPNRAAAMANAYVEQLRLLTKSMAAREASRQRAFYENQLKDQREALVMAEFNLQQVQQSKGLIHIAPQSIVMLEGVGELRAQIAAKEVEVQALRSFSTEHNSDVQLAEQELATLRQEAAKMSEHGSSSDFADIGLKDIPKAGLDFLRAMREVEYQTALYGALLKQYESFRLDEANDAYNIEVVDQAAVPDRHSFPKRAIFMVIAAILGLIAGVMWVRYRRRWMEWMAEPDFVVALRRLKAAAVGR